MTVTETFNLVLAFFVIAFIIFNFGIERGWIRWE